MKRQIFVNGKPHYATAQLVGKVQSMVEHNYTVAQIADLIRRTIPFTHKLVMSIKDEAQMGRVA
ncbi:MAG: hypothetical protein MK214_16445 [Thalassotalea sp.]|nr:hypothetical protein [Thalassotalea sp.]